MLATRFGKPENRFAAAVKLVKERLPDSFNVQVEKIGFKPGNPAFGTMSQTYYLSSAPVCGEADPKDLVGADLNITDGTGRSALQVRLILKGRPIVGYATETDLPLALILAGVLRRDGLFVRRLPVAKIVDEQLGNARRDPTGFEELCLEDAYGD